MRSPCLHSKTNPLPEAFWLFAAILSFIQCNAATGAPGNTPQPSVAKKQLQGGGLKVQPKPGAPAKLRPIKDKWAVVIGIDKFKDSKITPLAFPSKDARDFAGFLIEKGNFKSDHVRMLLNESATRDNIKDTIGGNWLPRRAAEDDLVVIFASTHGSPKELDVAGQNFLVAYDSEFDNLYVTGIRLSDLAPEIKERTGCDRIVIFLDACNSGSANVGGKGLVRTSNFDVSSIAGEGQIVISSSSANQVSYESQRYDNGVFTKQLIAALQTNGEKTTVNQAFESLKEKVETEVRFDRKRTQTPVMKSRWAGTDLILTAPPSRPRQIDDPETAQTETPSQRNEVYDKAKQLVAEKRFSEATDLLSNAEGDNNLPAINYLAFLYRTGTGVEKNDSRAVELYRKAAAMGYLRSQFQLGRMIHEGKGTAKNCPEAMQWLQKAAEAGETDAQTYIGNVWKTGDGVNRDYEKAIQWWKKAAEKNDRVALYNLGIMAGSGFGMPANESLAFEYFQKAAQAGYPPACGRLGSLYETGKGVPLNYENAALWYQKAADSGDESAQCQLGLLYAGGKGVPQNDQKAVEWYRKAAEKGGKGGAFYLGYMYATGRGVPRSDSEAFRWYKKSAEAGELAAQNNLGNVYENGIGVARDYEMAAFWFSKAADGGNSMAMNNLAQLYLKGLGVPRDATRARELAQKSLERGFAPAQRTLDLLNMSPPGY